MKTRSLVAAANIGFIFLLVLGINAQAAEVKVLSAAGYAPVLQDLAPKFERATGHKLAVTYSSGAAIVKRVQGGETTDLIIMPRQFIDRLVKDGKVAAGNVTVVARSPIGVAVRQGAPKPNISSPDALKRTLLAAKSITYTDPTNPAANNTIGNHLIKVFDRLGITDEMKAKTVFSRTVDVGDLIAKGDAEIGMGQSQNLILASGIELVGPLPVELQDYVVFAAVIMSGATDTAALKALVDFLRTPDAAVVIRAKGMEPDTP